MENIIVILAVAVAVWYLFRRWKKTVNSDRPGCCGDCGCSGPSTENLKPGFPIDDKNNSKDERPS